MNELAITHCRPALRRMSRHRVDQRDFLQQDDVARFREAREIGLPARVVLLVDVPGERCGCARGRAPVRAALAGTTCARRRWPRRTGSVRTSTPSGPEMIARGSAVSETQPARRNDDERTRRPRSARSCPCDEGCGSSFVEGSGLLFRAHVVDRTVVEDFDFLLRNVVRQEAAATGASTGARSGRLGAAARRACLPRRCGPARAR